MRCIGRFAYLVLGAAIMFTGLTLSGHAHAGFFDSRPADNATASGIRPAEAHVIPGASGLTAEQTNIKKRVELENKPGTIEHLYVISAMSGQVLLYSTVKGKVTSSGKRLVPKQVTWSEDGRCTRGASFLRGGHLNCSSELIQDDGTFGNSIPYLYWWDAQGRYHQHYISGGQIIHISTQPIPVKNVVINMELDKAK